MNKKLELIELEPYEAPALYEIAAVETLHGGATIPESDPDGPGGSDPGDEDEPGGDEV